MNVPLKIAIGLGTLGATGGGAYLITTQLSKDNILKKLEQEGYSKLANNNQEWETILNNYKETIATGKNADLKFEGLEGTETKEKLQEKCKKAFNKASNDNSSYKKAKKWCTTPKKLTEILKKEGYTALNSDTNSDEEQSNWNTKLKSYDTTIEPAEKKFNSLDLKTSGVLKEDKETRNKLKTECKGLDKKSIMKKTLK